jgi:small subunit ribosomal protein S7
MPRRQSIPRKSKYETIPVNRTTARITAKLMVDGKRHLAERLLRQALARAEAQAKRPGLEVLEAALRNATPIIEVKPRRVGGAMSEKLAAEFVDAMNGLGAAVKRREDTHKMADANKAFSHFKW